MGVMTATIAMRRPVGVHEQAGQARANGTEGVVAGGIAVLQPPTVTVTVTVRHPILLHLHLHQDTGQERVNRS